MAKENLMVLLLEFTAAFISDADNFIELQERLNG